MHDIRYLHPEYPVAYASCISQGSQEASHGILYNRQFIIEIRSCTIARGIRRSGLEGGEHGRLSGLVRQWETWASENCRKTVGPVPPPVLAGSTVGLWEPDASGCGGSHGVNRETDTQAEDVKALTRCSTRENGPNLTWAA